MPKKEEQINPEPAQLELDPTQTETEEEGLQETSADTPHLAEPPHNYNLRPRRQAKKR